VIPSQIAEFWLVPTQDPVRLTLYIIVPLGILLILGTSFLLAGFIALVRIRRVISNLLLHFDAHHDIQSRSAIELIITSTNTDRCWQSKLGVPRRRNWKSWWFELGYFPFCTRSLLLPLLLPTSMKLVQRNHGWRPSLAIVVGIMGRLERNQSTQSSCSSKIIIAFKVFRGIRLKSKEN